MEPDIVGPIPVCPSCGKDMPFLNMTCLPIVSNPNIVDLRGIVLTCPVCRVLLNAVDVKLPGADKAQSLLEQSESFHFELQQILKNPKKGGPAS